MSLLILSFSLLKNHLLDVPDGLQHEFDGLKDAELSNANFSLYTSVAPVFSSKIEGEAMELELD